MYVRLFRESRNEELIKKIVETKGNHEKFNALWENRVYPQAEVLDSLLYAAEDGLITLNVREHHLAEWLDEELYQWVPEHFSDWVKDTSGTEVADLESDY